MECIHLVKTGPCTTHGRSSSRCTTFRHGYVTKENTLYCLFLSKVRCKLASIVMCSWKHSWKIWQNSRMKGCVCGTNISRSISRCMQSYSFASMMLSGAFQYQGQTKGKSGTCPICVDGTASAYLPSSRKLVYMRHRRFLRRKHKYLKIKSHFDNTVKKDNAPK
jgi:hypothetical protein